MDTPGSGPDNPDDTSSAPPPIPSWGARPSGGDAPAAPPTWGPPPTPPAETDQGDETGEGDGDDTAAQPATPGLAAAAGIPISTAAADDMTEELFSATGAAGAGTPPTPPPPGGAAPGGTPPGDDGERRLKRNRRLVGAVLAVFLVAAAVTAIVTSDDDDGDDGTELSADADSTTSTRRSTTTTRQSSTTSSPFPSITATTVASTGGVTTTTKATATTPTTRRARTTPQRYGDDPTLDRLYRECNDGNFQSCDDLYDRTDAGTEYNDFGDTCGNRNAPGPYCVGLYDQQVPDTYGDDPQLDALWDRCASDAADFAVACDQVYNDSGIGTQYEHFGETCGQRLAARDPIGRSCQEIY